MSIFAAFMAVCCFALAIRHATTEQPERAMTAVGVGLVFVTLSLVTS